MLWINNNLFSFLFPFLYRLIYFYGRKFLFYFLKKIYAIEVDVDKREIYGQLDNYKFTFDLVTRDIKSIQNLETGEFLKISLE